MPNLRKPNVPLLVELLARGEFDVRDGRVIKPMLDARDVRGLRQWLDETRRLDALASATRQFVGAIAENLKCSRADAIDAIQHLTPYARSVERQRDHAMSDEWLLAMDALGVPSGEVDDDRRQLIARVMGKDRRDVLDALSDARARNRRKNPRRTKGGSRRTHRRP